MRTVINNPDTQKKFHRWFFCNTCHKVWKQNESLTHHQHCTLNDIRTIPTSKPFVIIGE
jgi:predicted metal-binding protein